VGDRAVILLVEDNEDDIALTKRALARNEQPYRLVVARDGLEALDLVFEAAPQVDDQATVQPQLILLDIQLPGLSGIDLLQQIRAHERTRFTPVVMLTSSVEASDVVASYTYGASSYIRKPVDFEEFVTALADVVHYWLNLNISP